MRYYNDAYIESTFEPDYVPVRFINYDTGEELYRTWVQMESSIYLSDYDDYLIGSYGVVTDFVDGDGIYVYKAMDIECEVLKFDYYFNDNIEFANQIGDILKENNGDLSKKTFGLSNEYKHYWNYEYSSDKNKYAVNIIVRIFSYEEHFNYTPPDTELIKTPKWIYGKNIENISAMFCRCWNIQWVSPDLLKYLPNCKSIYLTDWCTFKMNRSAINMILQYSYKLESFGLSTYDFDSNTSDYSTFLDDKTTPANIDIVLNCPNYRNIKKIGNMYHHSSKIKPEVFKELSALEEIDAFIARYTNNATYPEDLFKYNTKLKALYQPIGQNSKTDGIVKTIPEKLLYYNTELEICEQLFAGFRNLTDIPKNLFINNKKLRVINECFSSCDIKIVPSNLLDNLVNLEGVFGLFQSCKSLTTVPYDLFKNNLKIDWCRFTFSGCSNITSKIPNLWETCPDADPWDHAYGCTKAANYAEIPDEWK